MQLWPYCLLVTERLLYMFRALSVSIIRSAKNCSSSKDVQGLLPLHCSGNRPWTSLRDIYHPDPWLAPVTATTVFSTTDGDCSGNIRKRNLLSGYPTYIFTNFVLHCSGNRPWTSLRDIYHPYPWLAPVAATTVFSTPDDGRRKRPKHIEWFCSD